MLHKFFLFFIATPRVQRMDESANGFTLIELLVVLVILGFLAVIAAPAMFRSLDGAKMSAADVQMESLGNALEQFRQDIGRYPVTSEGLIALINKPPGLREWNGPYLGNTTNLNDPWGNPYVFRAPGLKGKYDLYSLGTQGAQGRGGRGDSTQAIVHK